MQIVTYRNILSKSHPRFGGIFENLDYKSWLGHKAEPVQVDVRIFDKILTAGDQKRLGGCMNGLNKLSIKHRLTFNHKLANSMSEKAKQGRFMKSYWYFSQSEST